MQEKRWGASGTATAKGGGGQDEDDGGNGGCEETHPVQHSAEALGSALLELKGGTMFSSIPCGAAR